MLHIFNNLDFKSRGERSVKLFQFLCVCVFGLFFPLFFPQKARTYHAYVKISLVPRKFGREIVRTVFHNHLRFPAVNLFQSLKICLPLAVI